VNSGGTPIEPSVQKEVDVSESFDVSTILPASAQRIYRAWLSSEEHAAFIGASAEINPGVGGRFSMWDGYIEGVNEELEPDHRIVQRWRTTEFPPESPDSRLEIVLEEVAEGTRLTMYHTEIPEGQGDQYREGWEEHYFEGMREYFSSGD
jgi:uncharacterized protein YndB with AHSA1/START domain